MSFFPVRVLCLASIALMSACSEPLPPPEVNIDDENAGVEIVTIASGDQPVSGTIGPKILMHISNQELLEQTWPLYVADEVPPIDFNEETLILFDRGSMDLNHCGRLAEREVITAEFFPDTGITKVNVNYLHSCPNKDLVCTAMYQEARPFVIVSIPAAAIEELYIGETVTQPRCQN